jgi:hypothetical protein
MLVESDACELRLDVSSVFSPGGERDVNAIVDLSVPLLCLGSALGEVSSGQTRVLSGRLRCEYGRIRRGGFARLACSGKSS